MTFHDLGEGADVSGEANGTPVALSPSAARRRIGLLLRELRQAAGLTLAEAAEALHRSPATMSRLETLQKTPPRGVEVMALLDLYETKTEVSAAVRKEMLGLVNAGRAESWFDEFRDVTEASSPAVGLRKLLELENDATEIWSYQNELIHGLVQTRAYAEAIAAEYVADEAQRPRFVELRMRRQAVVERLKGLHLFVNEVALRRQPPGVDATVLIEQLSFLGDIARGGRSNVELRVVPADLAVPAATSGPFVAVALDGQQTVVYLESRVGTTFLYEPEQFTRYEGEFAALEASALSVDAAVELLEEIAAGLR